eukprot:g8559.t1
MGLNFLIKIARKTLFLDQDDVKGDFFVFERLGRERKFEPNPVNSVAYLGAGMEAWELGTSSGREGVAGGESEKCVRKEGWPRAGMNQAEWNRDEEK